MFSLQSCPTPDGAMDCSSPDSSVHGIFQARILEWGAISFPTQELNPGLLHFRQMIYQLSYEGSPQIDVDILSIKSL